MSAFRNSACGGHRPPTSAPAAPAARCFAPQVSRSAPARRRERERRRQRERFPNCRRCIGTSCSFSPRSLQADRDFGGLAVAQTVTRALDAVRRLSKICWPRASESTGAPLTEVTTSPAQAKLIDQRDVRSGRDAHARELPTVEHRHDLHALGELVRILRRRSTVCCKSAGARAVAGAAGRRRRQHADAQDVAPALLASTLACPGRTMLPAPFWSRVSLSVSSTPPCTTSSAVGIDRGELHARSSISRRRTRARRAAVADHRDAGDRIALGQVPRRISASVGAGARRPKPGCGRRVAEEMPFGDRQRRRGPVAAVPTRAAPRPDPHRRAEPAARPAERRSHTGERTRAPRRRRAPSARTSDDDRCWRIPSALAPAPATLNSARSVANVRAKKSDWPRKSEGWRTFRRHFRA